MTVRELMETCASPVRKTLVYAVEVTELKPGKHVTMDEPIVEFDGVQSDESSYLKRIVLNAQVLRWEHCKTPNYGIVGSGNLIIYI